MVSDPPLQGSARPQNETIVNAIKLALDQRNNKAGDVTINYQSQDDATVRAGKWDEAKCAQSAARKPDYSRLARTVQLRACSGRDPDPRLGRARMVGPANTYIGLTKQGADPDEPKKYYPTGDRNYTRTIVADDEQGRAGAVWMRELAVKSVYILDETRRSTAKGSPTSSRRTPRGSGSRSWGARA